MLKNILLICCLLISIKIAGQETKNLNQDYINYFPHPKVDKRIELISIVFRLAGNREFNGDDFKSYTQDIHNYFDKFKDHPLIHFASKLRAEKGVSYDAVMKMAFHIGESPSFSPKVEFTDIIPEKRWGKENAIKFLELLRDFNFVSGFEKFYYEHADLYSITETRFLSVYNALNINWFYEYYGLKPVGSFNIIISIGNGGGNYGGKLIYADNKEEAFAIMGTWDIDSTNKPVYKIENYLPTLIHEFNHSFVNQLVDKYSSQLESSGKAIFEPIRENMGRQAYSNWKTMISESIVRASVIRYLLRYDSYQAAKNQLISEIGKRFYWMQGLVNILHDYENNRLKYKNLESFMPIIIDFYDKIALESKTIYEIKK